MNIAIILSGGVGSRMGTNIPKQYIEINGKPVLWYSLKTFMEHPDIDVVVIGCADEWLGYVREQIGNIPSSKPVFYSQPGETRQYSIYNALKVAWAKGCEGNDIVIIHDAARPLVSACLISSCLEACKDADGVLLVIPVKDTIYQSTDREHISSLLNRSELFAGQAPEAFVLGKYLALHDKMPKEDLLKINGSTEIAYKGGMEIKLVRGDEMNFKITTPEDLLNFENIIKNNKQ